MFSIVRLIIGCAFLLCSIIVINNSKKIRKRVLYTVFIGISIVLIVILEFLPFENFYMTFDSPQAAYEYVNCGKSNIELVVEGDNSDFVVDCKSNADVYLIIPKTADGWKIGLGLNTKKVVQNFANGIVLYVYQYKNTKDYFITILDTNGGESNITDSYNSEFYSLEKTNNSIGKTFVTYYTHVSNLDFSYYVTVNGNKIMLQNQ